MFTTHLYRNTTNRYNDAWKHLDEQQFIVSVKLTPRKQTVEPRDFDDGGRYVQYARIPAGATKADKKHLLQAVRDTMSKTDCRHEHDCCGCALIRAYPTLQGRTLRIETSVGYNY